jgi:MFS family permease
VLAFIVGGLREIGEPARKAMITELAPPTFRTQAIGIYWALRHTAVMLAPLFGGLLWLVDPKVLLWSAGTLGIVGALWFYLRFAGATKEAGFDLHHEDEGERINRDHP